jgi:hypothetical protein
MDPSTISTESLVLAEGEAPLPGFKYLLEVFLVKDVIEVWSKWRGGKRPSRAERSAAVAHFASHDAYLPTEHATQAGGASLAAERDPKVRHAGGGRLTARPRKRGRIAELPNLTN